MRVKAALASSLAYRPRLIVLDEPFSGLDVLVREQLIESILERTPEATVFLASHDLAEIESFASHIGYLNDGNLEFVEEMPTLSERFREMEITLGEAAALPRPAGSMAEPGTNRRGGALYGFAIRCGAQPRGDSAALPAAKEVTARVLSLRSIVVALAKSARSSKGAK